MWSIALFLFAGIAIGYFRGMNEKEKKINSALQQAGLVFLLFSMGCAIGANKDILSNIFKIGKVSASFALLTSLFSIACVFLITSRLVKGAE